jgi:hypothetical protein
VHKCWAQWCVRFIAKDWIIPLSTHREFHSSAPWVDLLPQNSLENTGPDFQQGRAANRCNLFAYVFAAEPSIVAVRTKRAQFNELLTADLRINCYT